MAIKFDEISGVEVFSTGVHKGKHYNERDLDTIVANFKKFSAGSRPLVDVPGVIGHEENQTLLENTGIPKVGRLNALSKRTGVNCRWCENTGTMELGDGERISCPCCQGTGKRTILEGHLADIHPKIADAIRNKHYDKVSLELYPKPPEGVPGGGLMARRLAILGGQLPQIKDLDSLPSNFSEQFSVMRDVEVCVSDIVDRGNGVFEVFSELVPVASMKSKVWSRGDLKDQAVPAKPNEAYRDHRLPGNLSTKYAENIMDRQAMLAKLEAMGVDVSKFTPENISDEALAAICGPMGGQPEEHAETESIDPVTGKPKIDPVTGKAIVTPASGTGGMGGTDQSQYAEGRRKFAEYCKKMSEIPPMKTDASDPINPNGEGGNAKKTELKTPEAKADAKFSEDIHKYIASEIKSGLEKIMGTLNPAVERVQKFAEETKRSEIMTFCETMLELGKITAAEMDATNPKVRPIYERLMAADATTPIRKFSENGKTVVFTELDMQKEEIRQKPANPRRQPKIKGDSTIPGNDGAKPEDTAVRVFSENAVALGKTGWTKDEFVETYKKASEDDRRALLRDLGVAA
jgi:hypothetical protein